MISYIVICGEPRTEPILGLSLSVQFPFSFVETQYVATPRQSANVHSSTVTVRVSNEVQAGWQLADEPLLKCMFQFAREHLQAKLQVGGDLEAVSAVKITSHSHPGPCPFDMALIDNPRGAQFELQVQRKIGFT